MLCDLCQKREANIIRSETINVEKTIIYRCEVCSNESNPVVAASPPLQKLERPCAKCRKEEGDVKLTRFVNGRRVATYLCQSCATA